jgi:excisionase family DNA binding protein
VDDLAEGERLLLVREVAERLRVHPRTVTVWLRGGTLPGIRLAGQWRVSEKDLAEFLKMRRREGAKGEE